MALKVGDKAPDFELTTKSAEGPKKIKLSGNSGKKNTVLIVLGDHQPLPIVSGQSANHDVPISIIAHDPKVLKQIGSWGWGPGLRPSPHAPVWPMDAFRNRFFSAFDSPAATR